MLSCSLLYERNPSLYLWATWATDIVNSLVLNDEGKEKSMPAGVGDWRPWIDQWRSAPKGFGLGEGGGKVNDDYIDLPPMLHCTFI